MSDWLKLIKDYIGYQGATSLADKLTLVRVGYLDNINNAQLLNISAARLGYIDRLTLLAAGGAGELTVARVGYLDNINQAGLLQVTAVRAGYLDNLSAGAVALNADAVLIKASQARQLFSLDYWSEPQLSVVIPAAAANQALPDVVMSVLPAGATVVKANGMIKFRSLTNAGAANKLFGAQHIQIQKGGAGGYADCISLIDDQFTVAAAAVDTPGDVVIGDHNVVAKVDANATYNFQWTSAVADVAGLTFNDVQMGLRIWYSV